MISPSFEEFNETCGDVVAAEALASTDVLSAGCIHDSFNSLDKICFLERALLEPSLVDIFVGPGDRLLRRHAVPETVAGEEHELAVGLDGDDCDVGVGGHGLVLRLHGWVVLVFEVTERSGKGQHAVNAPIFDEAISVVDALLLDGIIGLVVLREGHGLLAARKHGSRVT